MCFYRPYVNVRETGHVFRTQKSDKASNAQCSIESWFQTLFDSPRRITATNWPTLPVENKKERSSSFPSDPWFDLLHVL